MLRGWATVNFYADDLEAAGSWYAELTGTEPYFRTYACPNCGDRSPNARCEDCGVDTLLGYLELRIGDSEDELGFINRSWAPHDVTQPGGATIYWHVDDLDATLARLDELGAKVHEPVRAHAEGFVTASVIDPFGNVLGVMFNEHYLEILARA